MSKVISGEDTSAFTRWRLPSVGGAGRGPESRNLLTAAQIEAVQKQAYEEGFAQGRQEGFASGQAELKQAVQRFEQYLNLLAEPLQALDREVEQQLTALAVAIARQLIRRELRTDPGQVVAVVREAVSALPAASRNIRVHLHPEDAALVREALSLGEEGERAWRVVDDPVLTRGGCRVQAEHSSVDASVEKRLAGIVATLLGGEREDDQPGA